MKNLWRSIDKLKTTGNTKYLIAFSFTGLIAALLGVAVWFILRTPALSTLDWMFCFAGYPVIFAWLFCFFYSCRHPFHH